MKKKLLLGAPAYNRAWIIPEWLDSLQSQDGIDCFDVEYIACVSPSEDNTLELLQQGGFIIITEDVFRQKYESDLHVWGNMNVYEKMAQIRNKLLMWAKVNNFDYFLSIDTDIILPKNGLQKMISFIDRYPGMVAPALSMVHNQTIWNIMDWVDSFNPNLAYRPKIRHLEVQQVDVIMACILMDKSAISKVKWKEHTLGEDVGLCIEAEKYEVNRWWLSTIKCDHRMHQI
jgi:glycosyltransferase involved in cell wall biosynthesis